MKNTCCLCLTLLLFSCIAESEQEQKKVDKELHYYEANNLEETEPYGANENIILVGEETSSILENITLKGPYGEAGRVLTLTIDRENTDHLICGSASGGIWNSYNRGETWEVVDDFLPSLTCKDIEQDPFIPSRYYASAGNVFQDTDGNAIADIYVSEDNAASFNLLPYDDEENVPHNTRRILCSEADSGVVYALSGPTYFERELFKSTDHGQTYTSVLRYTETGGSHLRDFDVAPNGDVNVITQYGFYRSTSGDFGTFTLVADTVLEGSTTAQIKIARSEPDVMYLMYRVVGASCTYETKKTLDYGLTWTTVSPYSCGCTGQALSVHPTNPNIVFNGATSMKASIDGGETYFPYGFNGIDYREVIFDPENGDVYQVNDQGIGRYDISPFVYPFDWSQIERLDSNLSNLQIHQGDYHRETDQYLIGVQDMGMEWDADGEGNLTHLMTGDGGWCFFHHQDTMKAYASIQGGYIKRMDNIHDPEGVAILNNLDLDDDNKIDDGYLYIQPFWVNYADGDQIYIPTKKRLWKSMNQGESWEKTSHTYTYPYINNMRIDGTHEVNPTIYWGVQDSLYCMEDAATADSSEVQSTFIGGNGILDVKISFQNKDRAFVVTSENFFETETYFRVLRVDGLMTGSPVVHNIGENLPNDRRVISIQQSATNDSILVVGTLNGLYYTANAGETWHKESEFPNVYVKAMRVRPSDNKLFIFTYGRGVWVANFPELVPSGLDEMSSEKPKLNIYPNPITTNYVTVQMPEESSRPAMVSIIDLKGKELQKSYYPASAAETGIQLDFTGISSGTYLIKITLNNQTTVHKVIRR